MKILFTDMDGTLLDSRKHIPPVNLQAIQKALPAGNSVVICTGRSFSSAKSFIEELGLTDKGCYAIVYNGGLIYDCHTEEVIFKKTLPLSYVSHIFTEAAKSGLHCQTYEGDYVVTTRDSPELAQYKWSSQMKVKVDPLLLEHLQEEPVKVLTSCLRDRKRHEAYRDSLQEWAKGKISLFFSSEYYLEHVPEGVSKGAAVHWLCSYLGVPVCDTLAVGDAENDISMLDAAGFAICMKNGTEETKKHADYLTTLDNNQGGVAEIIEKYLL